MQPTVRLLAADKRTELVWTDLSQSTATPYLLLQHAVAKGETIYVDIAHRDPGAAQGFYRVSAGPLLRSEGTGKVVYLPMTVR